MTSSGLSKTVLSSPGQSESQASEISSSPTSSAVFSRLKFEHSIDQSLSQLARDGHNKRLKMLRKELDYLQSTAWKYQAIDKYIGQ
jgi:hypothetical protein